ncbi:MAG: hypothetical protein DWI03_03915 [Planctomycetota bacterium]|nr:MAG: hypothetical protein DWI03_03915 [Planctomycetota bacterium]
MRAAPRRRRHRRREPARCLPWRAARVCRPGCPCRPGPPPRLETSRRPGRQPSRRGCPCPFPFRRASS